MERTAPQITEAQITPMLEILDSLNASGHTQITVSDPRPWDELQNGTYVGGHKSGALGRTAFVSNAGAITWIH